MTQYKQPPLMQATQPAARGASHPIEPRWRCARGFVRQQGIAADPRIPCVDDRRIAADRVRLFAISSCQQNMQGSSYISDSTH
jgi:hypothetical protein